jgi:glycosyltransferase involved in cell wall biosynthesis
VKKYILVVLMKRIVFVVNIDWFFLSHRLPLALEAINRGFEVCLLTADSGKKTEIEGYGINFIEVPFERSGKNLLHEWKCVSLLAKHYRRLNPDIIHHVTLKAALLGSFAAKISGHKNVINAISGLGYNFTDGRNGPLQKLIRFMMRRSFKSDHFYFILQNPDDIEMMKNQKFTNKNHYKLIKGSGVDLKEFEFTPPVTKDIIQILFPARILYDKGIMELIEAAKYLENDWKGKIIFILAGDCDENNKAVVREEDLKKHLIPGYIEWIGFRKDMITQYQQSDIVVLPSYREGLPKSLIEACAIGRPIITTDVPGCRECVIDGYNGRMVPVKTVVPLANAIEELCESKSLRDKMGSNSRVLAEQEFSIESVIEKTFLIYEELLRSN